MGLVKLYGARDSLEAHYLRGLLEAEGIPAVVMGETLSFARGDIPLTVETQPAVWVHEEVAEAAMAVVRRFLTHGRTEDGSAATAADSWTCPTCGEAVEGQFSQCWNCQTERPESSPGTDVET